MGDGWIGGPQWRGARKAIAASSKSGLWENGLPADAKFAAEKRLYFGKFRGKILSTRIKAHFRKFCSGLSENAITFDRGRVGCYKYHRIKMTKVFNTNYRCRCCWQLTMQSCFLSFSSYRPRPRLQRYSHTDICCIQ